VHCKVINVNPIEEGKGIFSTLWASYDIGEHYPLRTLFRSEDRYFLLTKVDMSIPPATVKTFDYQAPPPYFEEVDVDTNTPIWVRILYYAFPNQKIFHDLTRIHQISNLLRRNEIQRAFTQTTPIPPIMTGMSSSVSGSPIPFGIRQDSSAISNASLIDTLKQETDISNLEDTLWFTINNYQNLITILCGNKERTILLDEMFLYYLYGKLKGYQMSIENIGPDQLLQNYLKNLLYMEKVIPLEASQKEWESFLQELEERRLLGESEVEYGLVYATHRLLVLLWKLLWIGSP
jgi:hypothetical protein